MSRLTTKIEDGFYVADHAHNTDEVTHKLGKLEDLEEQLGCTLEVVFKALENGVYYEDVANCMKYMVVDLHFNLEGDFILYFDDEEYLLVKNYKRTWWLKKDKSE